MPDVFISYSRKNRDFVERIHAALAAQNRDIWIDWEDIPFTADWWYEICSGIESADTFIFIMTQESLSSPICTMEVDHAIQHGKRLVPVVYAPPDEKSAFAQLTSRTLDDNTRKAIGGRDMLTIANANWNALARHNWLYFKTPDEFDTHFNQLVDAIETDLDHVKEHTRLLIRAREWERKARSTSFLLDGAAIGEAETWLEKGVNKSPSPQPLHAEYIRASRKAESRQQRSLLAGVSVALVVALGLAVLAFFLYQQAETARGIAINSAETAATAQSQAEEAQAVAIAAQATAERNASESNSNFLGQRAQTIALEDPFLGYALALEAMTIDNPPPLAQQAFASVAFDTGAVRRFGTTGGIVDLAFSADGTTLITGTRDNTIVHWDVATAEVLDTRQLENMTVGAFSDDGRYTALSSSSGTVIVMDTITGEQLHTFNEFRSTVDLFDFSDDGRYLIGAASVPAESNRPDSRVIVWDTQTGRTVRIFEEHRAPVRAVALSSDGQSAVSASVASEDTREAAVIIVWQVSSGRVLRTWENEANTVAFSTDGQAVIAATDGPMLLREITTANPIQSWSETVNGAVVFSPDANFLAYGAADNSLYLWRLLDSERQQFVQLHSYSGSSDRIVAVAFSPDGNYIVSGSFAGDVFLWDVMTPNDELLEPLSLLPSEYAALSPDRSTVIFLAGNALHLRTVLQPGQQPLSGTHHSVTFSPDNQLVLTGSTEGPVTGWRYQTETSTFEFAQMDTAVGAIAFQSDSQAVLIGDEAGALVLLDMTGTEIRRFAGQDSAVTSGAFSPDNATALSSGADGSVNLWDVATGQLIRTLNGHAGRITGAAFSPDGRYALTGDDQSTLILWDVASGTALHTLTGSGTFTSSISFSPDSRRVLTGFDDGTMILWDVADGTALRTFLDHTGTITSIVYSEDGLSASSVGTDGLMITRRVDSLPEIVTWMYGNYSVRELSCQERVTYNVQPTCDDTDTYPTRTPYPTLTPMP